MKTIKVSAVVYELLLEMAKEKRFRTVELFLDSLARGKTK